jgi:transposase
MKQKRKQHSDRFKAKVALEAIKEEITLAEISHKYGIHSTQIQRWKRLAIDLLPEIFSKSADQVARDADKEKDELYKHIGQLKVELDWLKKKSGLEY